MADTQSQSDSIIIGNCLSCQGLVRVPSITPAQSRVRCPHCSESYWLSQILDQAVPELEVVSAPEVESVIPHIDQVLVKTAADESDTPKKFVVPAQLSKGAKRSKRRRRSGDSSVEIDINSSESVGSSLKSGTDRRSEGLSDSSRQRRMKQSRRSQARRGKNNFIEILKIATGGLLAIPIAYLLVFWVFQRDPLHLGPGISKVVPVLVPAKFHGSEDED